MAAWGCHELSVCGQPLRGIVAATCLCVVFWLFLRHRAKQDPQQLSIEGVLSRAQSGMIMHVPLLPQMLFPVENHATDHLTYMLSVVRPEIGHQ